MSQNSMPPYTSEFKQSAVKLAIEGDKITTDSSHDLPVFPNHLNRQFEAAAPDQAYVGDITLYPDTGRLVISGGTD